MDSFGFRDIDILGAGIKLEAESGGALLKYEQKGKTLVHACTVSFCCSSRKEDFGEKHTGRPAFGPHHFVPHNP